MKDVKWRVISPAKHYDPKVVAEVLMGQVDMLVAGRQYTIDGSVVEIGSIGSLSQMGIQLVPEVDKPTMAPQPEPSANVPESPNSSSPVSKLVSCLSQGMQNDQDLAWTWHCNIVAASLDEDVDHETANRAAARFMSVAFGVDVTAFDEWSRFDWAKKPPQPEPAAERRLMIGDTVLVVTRKRWNGVLGKIIESAKDRKDRSQWYVESSIHPMACRWFYTDELQLANDPPQPEPSVNVPESPDSSVDHSADANEMVEPKIVARYDTEGRDVTELPGLWSEDDTQYREITEDDRKNLPIKCEVRGSRGLEWFKAKLVRICENPTHPYIAETDHGRVVQAAHCRIKVAPTVKESLTVDTPDPTKITIGYTVPNAYQADAEPITEPIERKRVLYIAGPMRGIAFFNYPMFDRVRNHLTEAGNDVISPADEDRKHDGFNPYANPAYHTADNCIFPEEMDFHKTVRRCLDAVLRCDEIVLLPGWEASNGAVAELTLAMWLGKRVRHLKIANNGGFLWSCYWMGLAGLACLLRDHHIPEVEVPWGPVDDEDDDEDILDADEEDILDEDEDEDILDTAARITRGDRNASYGPPDQDFRRTAGMWSALFGAKLQDGVTFEPRDVAMAMILLKCSRESHQRKLDNWVDIAGYARCGSKCN